MSPYISIIDYGLGNLYSVWKAMQFLGVDVNVIDTPSSLKDAEGVILPGVGAFGDGIKRLGDKGFVEPLKEYVNSGRPLLGICLGMQFLFSYSEEFGVHKGLDIINGRVVRFSAKKIDRGFDYKIPHIGWNRLIRPSGIADWSGTVLEGIEENEEAYFVHSFVAVPEDESVILSYTEYGNNPITAVVKKGNIYGCQFHPEKSRGTGIRILQNFINIASACRGHHTK